MEDLLSRVSFHTKGSVIQEISIKTSSDQDDDNGHEISLEDHVYRGRVNFPHNCFILDLTNNTNVVKKGIKVLNIRFKDLNVSTSFKGVEVHSLGHNLACNRALTDHSFYAAGQKITLDGSGVSKKYVMEMKQNVFDQGTNKNCRTYPNRDFATYK